ncbi:MAG: hypothetical protein ACI84R_003756 [Candidatus Azotimanducaceae bacterium]|jgi:hypothetical protein
MLEGGLSVGGPTPFDLNSAPRLCQLRPYIWAIVRGVCRQIVLPGSCFGVLHQFIDVSDVFPLAIRRRILLGWFIPTVFARTSILSALGTPLPARGIFWRPVLQCHDDEGGGVPLACGCCCRTCQHNPRHSGSEYAQAHVLQLFNRRVKDVRENAAQGAYLRIAHQLVNSPNEFVKLDANKWVAGVDDISPVQKVEGRHSIARTFTGYEYPDLEPVDVSPEDETNKKLLP